MPNPRPPKPEPPSPANPADVPEPVPADPPPPHEPGPDHQIQDSPVFPEHDKRYSSGVALRDPPGKLAAGHEEEQERQRRKVQKQLDEALEASFPASDPVSIVTSQAEEDWGEGETAPAPPAPKAP
jgi:hypothetical protein